MSAKEDRQRLTEMTKALEAEGFRVFKDSALKYEWKWGGVVPWQFVGPYGFTCRVFGDNAYEARIEGWQEFLKHWHGGLKDKLLREAVEKLATFRKQ